ncbi:hypothetical protein BDF14DRAFT_1878757 [Spinellus fusiger]|nr:hypothetical protein BDF14DRAFT_1878757 [Spinellus fusiger]
MPYTIRKRKDIKQCKITEFYDISDALSVYQSLESMDSRKMDSRHKALDQINNMLLESINESKLIDSYERLPANAKYIWVLCTKFNSVIESDAYTLKTLRGEVAQIIRDKANSYDRNEVEGIFGFVWTDNDNDNAKQADKINHVPVPRDFVDLTTIYTTLQEIQVTLKNRDDIHSNAFKDIQTTSEICSNTIGATHKVIHTTQNNKDDVHSTDLKNFETTRKICDDTIADA